LECGGALRNSEPPIRRFYRLVAALRSANLFSCGPIIPGDLSLIRESPSSRSFTLGEFIFKMSATWVTHTPPTCRFFVRRSHSITQACTKVRDFTKTFNFIVLAGPEAKDALIKRELSKIEDSIRRELVDAAVPTDTKAP
jgi:hypothetical protein